MSLCPFLTTKKEKVMCFKECCFFKEESNCIFMELQDKKDYDNVDDSDDGLYLEHEEENKIGDYLLEEYIHI